MELWLINTSVSFPHEAVVEYISDMLLTVISLDMEAFTTVSVGMLHQQQNGKGKCL
jgi:hypothetical protein